MHARILSLLIAALILSACAPSTPRVVLPPAAPPPDARCDTGEIACSSDCDEFGDWPADADGSGDFDALAALAVADARTYATCRARLRACQACLDRLAMEGVIRAWR